MVSRAFQTSTTALAHYVPAPLARFVSARTIAATVVIGSAIAAIATVAYALWAVYRAYQGVFSSSQPNSISAQKNLSPVKPNEDLPVDNPEWFRSRPYQFGKIEVQVFSAFSFIAIDQQNKCCVIREMEVNKKGILRIQGEPGKKEDQDKPIEGSLLSSAESDLVSGYRSALKDIRVNEVYLDLSEPLEKYMRSKKDFTEEMVKILKKLIQTTQFTQLSKIILVYKDKNHAEIACRAHVKPGSFQ